MDFDTIPFHNLSRRVAAMSGGLEHSKERKGYEVVLYETDDAIVSKCI